VDAGAGGENAADHPRKRHLQPLRRFADRQWPRHVAAEGFDDRPQSHLLSPRARPAPARGRGQPAPAEAAGREFHAFRAGEQ